MRAETHALRSMVKVEGMHPLPSAAQGRTKTSRPDGPGGWPGPFYFPPSSDSSAALLRTGKAGPRPAFFIGVVFRVLFAYNKPPASARSQRRMEHNPYLAYSAVTLLSGDYASDLGQEINACHSQPREELLLPADCTRPKNSISDQRISCAEKNFFFSGFPKHFCTLVG